MISLHEERARRDPLVKQPTKYACEVVADGLRAAIRYKDWESVAWYARACERVSKGLPPFERESELVPHLDHLQEPGRNGEHYPNCDCSQCENDRAAIASGGDVAR